MLLIVASRFDSRAAGLVRRWAADDAQVLTCRSLSRPGWVFDPARPAVGTFVTDAGPVPVDDLQGLVSLLPAVHADELPHVAPEDRDYVAAEMHAFLVAWLASLPCTVLGHPTPYCLTGPHLRHEQWIQQAARAGLTVRPWTRAIPSAPAEFLGRGTQDADVRRTAKTGVPEQRTGGSTVVGSGRPISVVAGHVVPEPEAPPLPSGIEEAAARMALAVGAGLLTVTVELAEAGWTFADATPTVDVSLAGVADALLAALGGQS